MNEGMEPEVGQTDVEPVRQPTVRVSVIMAPVIRELAAWAEAGYQRASKAVEDTQAEPIENNAIARSKHAADLARAEANKARWKARADVLGIIEAQMPGAQRLLFDDPMMKLLAEYGIHPPMSTRQAAEESPEAEPDIRLEPEYADDGGDPGTGDIDL